MSRSAPVIPVNAKMYRHFAIATVLITGTLAMFASGENQQAVEDHLAAQQRLIQSQEAERKLAAQGRGGNTKSNFEDRRKVKGSFGSDGVEQLTPSSRPKNYGGYANSVQAELVAAEPAFFTTATGPGVDPNAITGASGPPPGMSPEQYAYMLNQKKRKKPAGKAPEKPTEQQTAALFEASKARSQTRAE
jgi:hypothetical protein